MVPDNQLAITRLPNSKNINYPPEDKSKLMLVLKYN